MYTLQHQLYISGKGSPTMVTVPRHPEKFIIGFKNKEMANVSKVANVSSTKISYVENKSLRQIDWAKQDPLLRDNMLAYHTIPYHEDPCESAHVHRGE